MSPAPATPPSRLSTGALLSAGACAIACGIVAAAGCQELLAVDDPTVHVGETTTLRCLDCHEHDYNNAVFPVHAKGVIDRACASCHVQTAWSPAKWAHGAWTLTGAHLSASCGGCHRPSDAVLRTPPSSCVDCHKSDYAAATAPVHRPNSFPITCQDCHSTTAWVPADAFKHGFPIDTGDHAGLGCSSCHPNAEEFKAISCVTGLCHEPLETDAVHSKLPLYQYESSACVLCHADGKAPK